MTRPVAGRVLPATLLASLLLSAAALPSRALAADAPFAEVALSTPIQAQRLADRIVAEHPGMLDALFHVTPPGGAHNIVVAAHLRAAVGELSGDDDLGVMRTGKPLVEVQKDGVRIGVLVQLRDAHGRAIGALGLMYAYRAGEDQAAFLARSNAIRDRLAHRIPAASSLFATRGS